MGPEISVIVPFWDENLNVLPLTTEIGQALKQPARELEVILVDDGSTDCTWEKILEAQRTDHRVRPVRLLRHCGQSAAL